MRVQRKHALRHGMMKILDIIPPVWITLSTSPSAPEREDVVEPENHVWRLDWYIDE